MKLLDPVKAPSLSRPRALQYATIRRALQSEQFSLPTAKEDRWQYIERFVREIREGAPSSAKPKRGSPESKRPQLLILPVKRRGRWGMLSINPRLYRLHSKLLGAKQVRSLLNEIGPEIDHYMHSGHFSKRMREELIKRTKKLLNEKQLKAYRQELKKFLPAPARTYVTVPVRRAKGKRPYTTVVLDLPLYKRARAIMGPKSFRAWIVTASALYEEDKLYRNQMSRSEYTRHILAQEIFLLLH